MKRLFLSTIAATLFLTACGGPAEGDMSASEPDTPKIDVTTQTSTETARKPVSASTNQPNILIIVADDLGWADLGFRGSDIQTPNIDRLAAQGIHLERFYVMPICTPTRSALMTARDPMKLGSAYAGFQPWQNGGVAPQERFMPQDFQSAGYQTAMIGKWHLGHTTEPLVPNSRGFDHFFGHLNTQVDYYNYTVASGYDLQENGTSVQRDGTYATDVHGDETVRYITDIRDPDKPFFAYVPFLAPHSPMQAPEALKAKYPDRKDRPFTQKTYAAMVDSLDHNVGKIMDALDAQGIADNTIVLFFSDNGGLAAFGADNSPYRGGKLETFEGGVRVGGILRWPAQIEAGQASDAVVSVLDLYPSLAAAAGVDMSVEKPIDGQNRWAEMSGKSSEIRDGDLYFASNSPMFNRYHVSVMEARWKLVQIIDHQQTSTDVETYLFDIIEDPTETNNLADAHPDEVARLADKIRVWRAQHPINGVRVALAPHPGWRAPLDYAESVMPSSELQTGQFDSYVKGMRAQILQQRHGDKGKIVYD